MSWLFVAFIQYKRIGINLLFKKNNFVYTFPLMLMRQHTDVRYRFHAEGGLDSWFKNLLFIGHTNGVRGDCFHVSAVKQYRWFELICERGNCDDDHALKKTCYTNQYFSKYMKSLSDGLEALVLKKKRKKFPKDQEFTVYVSQEVLWILTGWFTIKLCKSMKGMRDGCDMLALPRLGWTACRCIPDSVCPFWSAATYSTAGYQLKI